MVDRAKNLSWTVIATVLAIGIAALIVMGEAGRLVASALTPDGDVGSIRSLVGPLGILEQDTWSTWAKLEDHRSSVALWIGVHTLADVFFYLTYVALLLRAFGNLDTIRKLVLVLLACEAAETVLLGSAAGALAAGSVPCQLAFLVALATTAKWLSVAAVAIAVLRSQPARAWLARRFRLFWGALKYQRWSAVPVVMLAALSIVPGPDIQDQLPDVYRAWVAGGRWWHGPVAFVSTALIAFLLVVLGRYRHRRAQKTLGEEGKPPDEVARLRVWLCPLIVLIVAAVLEWQGPDGTVDWVLVSLFVGIPVLLVAGLSRLLRARKPNLWKEEDDERPSDLPLVAEVLRVGDGLALGAVAVTGLGLVRAFTAPVLLFDGDHRVPQAMLLHTGLVLTSFVFPVGIAVVHRATAMAPPSPTGYPANAGVLMKTRAIAAQGYRGAMRQLLSPPEDTSPRWVGITAAVLSVVVAAVVACMMVMPRRTTAALGGVAVATLALGAWTVLLGFLTVYLQERQAPEVFRLMRMRAAPVLTLVLVVPLVATWLPSEAGLHRMRTLDPAVSAVAERGDLTKTFADWLNRSDECDRKVGPATVRPLLVVAASGGGIRAALWTASVIDALATSGPCGANAVLLSSGISGGAVGLAVARQSGDPIGTVTRLAGPDTLGAGVAGTLVGDMAAGLTGLRLPAAFDVHPRSKGWTDRAGLIELSWEEQVPGLAEPWDADVRGPAGALIFNSTEVGFGCRVLVSQVDLRLDGGAGEAANCRERSGLPAASLDLFDTYGECSPRLRWSTAAMLAARFPFVTPAGRVPRTGACKGDPDLQLVDGGYAEGSGLGTLSEIASDLVAVIRDHNSSDAGPYVVPLVAYLEDEVGSDVTVRPPDETPELLVPLAGRSAKGVQGTSWTYLQRIARVFATACPATAKACRTAAQGVLDELPDGAVLVAPSTAPSVSAPLGWALSGDSIDRMRDALAEELCDLRTAEGRYAGLGKLLRVLEPDKSLCVEAGATDGGPG